MNLELYYKVFKLIQLANTKQMKNAKRKAMVDEIITARRSLRFPVEMGACDM